MYSTLIEALGVEKHAAIAEIDIYFCIMILHVVTVVEVSSL